jgi:hypothetical protein
VTRCYLDDDWPDRACPRDAEYAARLTWTAGLMLLCEHHAQRERELGDVIVISRIRARVP